MKHESDRREQNTFRERQTDRQRQRQRVYCFRLKSLLRKTDSEPYTKYVRKVAQTGIETTAKTFECPVFRVLLKSAFLYCENATVSLIERRAGPTAERRTSAGQLRSDWIRSRKMCSFSRARTRVSVHCVELPPPV